MTSLDSIQQRQISLTHAYVVNNSARYSPSWQNIKKPSPSQVKDNILSRLNGSKVGGGYAVVWGPALAMDGDYAAHITVVLIGGKSGNDIVVVTSGTLDDSPMDQFDDLDIFPMVPLQNLIKSCPVPAKLSPGTLAGVNKILSTPSTIGFQGTLSDFLGKQRSGATIRLVGHSLGGALMSVVALYLKEKFSGFNFYCETIAAPTAGDGFFASYFNKQMAGNALRIYNTLDVVPMAWCATSLDFSLTLYEPTNVIDNGTKEMVCLAIDTVTNNNLNYTQWGMGSSNMELRLCGELQSKCTTYQAQSSYQHIYEYISLLGLQLGDIPMPPPFGS
ncbi:lipase family protein [Pseudomonas chlororaphis]|uniref:lipase family protein n=1 Tax=Pseudomonas chlororaphis TaxID=587753 RepID=UPI001389BAAC|nr:lipase family protein [Pseudomonas chlororaphis]QQX56996.1 lipase family protein [Pseudomonas chlororaphis subsp. aurantiaca]